MRKTALVTGGTRGIGRAIAENLALDHNVTVVWNKSAPPPEFSGDIFALQADLSDPTAVAAVVAQTTDHFGSLDVIVNNAGIVEKSPAAAFNLEDQRAILDVNLLAPGALLAAALPHLKAGASIVNITSVNARLPPKDASIYGASKAALELWTKAMGKELGPSGIRVNAVAPGAVNTPENPRPEELTAFFVENTALGRIGVPEDIARAVRFLASDEAGFITGTVLEVSGGYRL